MGWPPRSRNNGRGNATHSGEFVQTASYCCLIRRNASPATRNSRIQGGRRRSAATVAIHAVAADEHRVFSSASDGFIACWSREIGHLVWRVGAPGGATVGVLTLGVSLGQLIAGCDQSVVPISSPGHNRPAAEAQYRVFALSWRTGELQWTADGHSNAVSGVVVVRCCVWCALLSQWPYAPLFASLVHTSTPHPWTRPFFPSGTRLMANW